LLSFCKSLERAYLFRKSLVLIEQMEVLTKKLAEVNDKRGIKSVDDFLNTPPATSVASSSSDVRPTPTVILTEEVIASAGLENSEESKDTRRSVRRKRVRSFD